MSTQINFDKDLLFGLVGMEYGLVARDDFLSACELWKQKPDRSILEILKSEFSLDARDAEELRSEVEKSYRTHGGSMYACINKMAKDTLDFIAKDLAAIESEFIDASIQNARDPQAKGYTDMSSQAFEQESSTSRGTSANSILDSEMESEPLSRISITIESIQSRIRKNGSKLIKLAAGLAIAAIPVAYFFRIWPRSTSLIPSFR